MVIIGFLALRFVHHFAHKSVEYSNFLKTNNQKPIELSNLHSLYLSSCKQALNEHFLSINDLALKIIPLRHLKDGKYTLSVFSLGFYPGALCTNAFSKNVNKQLKEKNSDQRITRYRYFLKSSDLYISSSNELPFNENDFKKIFNDVCSRYQDKKHVGVLAKIIPPKKTNKSTFVIHFNQLTSHSSSEKCTRDLDMYLQQHYPKNNFQVNYVKIAKASTVPIESKTNDLFLLFISLICSLTTLMVFYATSPKNLVS